MGLLKSGEKIDDVNKELTKTLEKCFKSNNSIDILYHTVKFLLKKNNINTDNIKSVIKDNNKDDYSKTIILEFIILLFSLTEEKDSQIINNDQIFQDSQQRSARKGNKEAKIQSEHSKEEKKSQTINAKDISLKLVLKGKEAAKIKFEEQLTQKDLIKMVEKASHFLCILTTTRIQMRKLSFGRDDEINPDSEQQQVLITINFKSYQDPKEFKNKLELNNFLRNGSNEFKINPKTRILTKVSGLNEAGFIRI